MNNKLSHSAITTYMSCGEKYKKHYIERIRGNSVSSALLFGSAIDKALEELVKTGKLEDAQLKFSELWNKQEINGISTELKNCKEIQYSSRDTDLDLIGESVNELSDNEKAWLSLQQKGMLMIEAVHNTILPRFKKIHSTQEQINLSNEEGDSVIGFVDLVADWDEIGNTIVFDFKTASRAYEEDAVLTSPQLSLYMHAISEKYNTRKAGFIVINKIIKKNRSKICTSCGNDGSATRHKTCANEVNGKRCGGEFTETINPEAIVDVLINDIPEATEDLIIENADRVNSLIKEEKYIKNLKTCTNDYGKKCVYFDLCYHGKMDGLTKLPERIEK